MDVVLIMKTVNDVMLDMRRVLSAHSAVCCNKTRGVQQLLCVIVSVFVYLGLFLCVFLFVFVTVFVYLCVCLCICVSVFVYV